MSLTGSFGSLGIVVLAGAFLTLAACQSVANLDVKYNPDAGSATTSSSSSSGDPSTSPDGGAGTEDGGITPPDESLGGEELQGCPCEESEGLACCVSNAGTPFCTADQTRCDGESGGFYRCFGPDPEGSVCCLHRRGTTLISALAGKCDEPGASVVCRNDNDCNGGTCTITTCQGGVKIGLCDATPACPAMP